MKYRITTKGKSKGLSSYNDTIDQAIYVDESVKAFLELKWIVPEINVGDVCTHENRQDVLFMVDQTEFPPSSPGLISMMLLDGPDVGKLITAVDRSLLKNVSKINT